MYKYDHVLIEKTEKVMHIPRHDNTFKVQLNFQGPAIGEVLVRYEDGKLYGWFKLYKDCAGLYPSVGYQAKNSMDTGPHTLIAVSVCTQSNLDPEIAPL